MSEQLSLSSYIERAYLENDTDTLTNTEIYNYVENSDYHTEGKTPRCSIRARLQKNKKFMSVARGVWMLVNGKSQSLIIEGNGRELSGINDNTIDCIITDHPYNIPRSLKGGNRDMAKYECFRYTQEDFNAKARVLKPGSFLCEFLPWENGDNSEYLMEVRKMAKKAGFELYCVLDWRKFNSAINDARPDANTGRTTKGSEVIMVWSLGSPKSLVVGNKGRKTKEIVKQHIEDCYIKRKGEKTHQAEKPIELYEYLISCFTEEGDWCVDQFGGSCNMAIAATNKRRNSIVYEICHEFVEKAVARLGAVNVFKEEELLSSAIA